MRRKHVALWTCLALCSACASASVHQPPRPTYETKLVETPVQELRITGRLADPTVEISAMAWHEDTLILMPQFPSCTDKPRALCALTLQRSAILAQLDGDPTPLEAQELPIHAPELVSSIPGYEGVEGVGFLGDSVFLAIEARPNPLTMQGWLVPGRWTEDGITIDQAKLTAIRPMSGLLNKTEEAVVSTQDGLLTIHEINGENHNSSPRLHHFDADMTTRGTPSFPAIEFRVTDATTADADGRFWIMNYQWSEDGSLNVGHDPVFERFGTGPTHAVSRGVERILELRLQGDEVVITDRAPILIELGPKSRNWEGLVRLDGRGFLVATDRHPRTILGFVPYSL